MVQITPERLEKLKTPKGGMSRRVAELLGIWPLVAGWPARLLNSEIPEATFSRAVQLAAKGPRKRPRPKRQRSAQEEAEPDWGGVCENCGASPIVPLTGMCGPCTFGEADTIGGNW